MNEEEVYMRVRAVMMCRDDYEIAHSMEDKLHCDVLQAISKGECDDPAACAEAALTTAQIVFARHCT